MQWITVVIVPHRSASDREFYSCCPICPQKLSNSLQKQTPGRKDSENSIHFNELFHTRRCNIFTNMYNDKYKKTIPTKEDNINYSSIPVIIMLIFFFFCTIIAIRMIGTEHCSPSFSATMEITLSHISESSGLFCGEA